MKNCRKGQVTLVNLLELVVAFVVLLMLAPMLNTLVAQTVATLMLTPNQYTPIVTMALQLIIAVLAGAVIFTAMNYAIPKREGG